jgi:PKD repeat protein
MPTTPAAVATPLEISATSGASVSFGVGAPPPPPPPPAPVAEFIGSPLSGSTPLAVTFTDQSTGTITSRLWDFGDGTTSTAVNPTKAFLTAASFTVALTVTGPGGSNTRTRTAYVTATAPAPGPTPPPPPPPPAPVTAGGGSDAAVLRPMDTWAGSAAWTAGLSFAYGEVPSPETIGGAGASLQVDVRNRWPDNSLKFAVVSGITTSADVAVLRGSTPATGTAVAEPSIAASVTFTNVRNSAGTVLHASLVADLATARAAGAGTWGRTQPRKVREILGPVMSEFHYFAPTDDAHTSVWFYVRAYSNGAASVRVVVQNSWTQVASPGQRDYDVSISVGGSVVYTASNIVAFHHTRWTQLHWVGTGGVMAQSARHLQGTALVPRAAIDDVDATVWTALPDGGTKYAAWTRSLAERPTPFALANIDPALGAGGATDNVGPLPTWDVVYTITGDARAYWAVIGNAEAMGRFSLLYVDEVTGRPLEPSRYPNLRASGGGVSDAWGGSPATPSPSGGASTPVWAYTHGPKGGYLAYLLTGEWHHLQTVQHFSGFVPLWQPGDAAYRYGGPHTPIPFWLQLRGNANAWDFHFKAAIITPDRINDVAVTGADADMRADIIGRNDVSIRLWHDFYAPTGTFSNVGPYVGKPQSMRDNVFGVFYQENNVPVPEATVSQMQQGYTHNAIMWGFLARVPTARQSELEWLTTFCTRYVVGMLGAASVDPRPDWRLCTGFEQVVGSSDPYDGNWVMYPSWRAAWDVVAARPPAPSTTLTLPVPAGNFIHDASEVFSTPSWTVGFDIKAGGTLSPFNSHTHAFIWSVAFMHEVSRRLPISGADTAADRFYGSDSFFNTTQPGGGWTLWPGASVVSREWVPAYVPRTVGEAAVITTTNSYQSVRQTLPYMGQAIGTADFSGGAFNRWASRFGKHVIHGGGHSANDDASVYALSFTTRSVSFELLLGMYDLRDDGTWINYGSGAFGGLGNSVQYFIWRGPASTLPADPLNSAGWAVADDVTVNRREYKEGWPGSAHTYDTMRIIPPSMGGGPQGSLLRHGGFAVGAVVSMDTFWAHRFQLGQTSWTRYPQIMDSFARSSSLDTRRRRVLPFGTRSYRDMSNGNFAPVAGSVTGLPTGYSDNLLMEYHEARDLHVVIRNTQEERDAGTPSKWAWIAGGSTTTGAWTTVTWVGGTAPPNMASPGANITAQAGCVYIDALQQFCYYSRADVDAYYLVTVPANPADPWSWTRVPITGAGRPSLYAQPATHVYRRWDWAPALKCISYVPWSRDTGATIDKVILIRVVP